MPPYQLAPASDNAPVKTLQPGVNGYAFGSRNSNFPTTLMFVSQVAISGNVATVTVLIREGAIPTVGSLITITGTVTAGGVFNVTNSVIATVTIDPVAGTGTITFSLTHADVAPSADTGAATVPVPEVGEALANGSSQAFALPDEAGHNTNGRTITMSATFPSQPSTVTVTLQAAMVDLDSEYVGTGLSFNVTTPVNGSINLRLYRFVRAVLSNVSGGSSPTGIVRLSI